MAQATLTITSRNYGAWALRGWLLCRMSGLPFETVQIPPTDPDARAELLLMSPSFLVPCLTVDGFRIWDTLAIAEYLHEVRPEAGLYPADRNLRARCRSVSGEMHSGFANLRAALPMNLKGSHPGFKIWAGAQADIDRVVELWTECLALSGGPFLFGARPTVADAMYAPVCTRFITYDVRLDAACAAYRDRIIALPPMQEWRAEALKEPDDIEELDAEF